MPSHHWLPHYFIWHWLFYYIIIIITVNNIIITLIFTPLLFSADIPHFTRCITPITSLMVIAIASFGFNINGHSLHCHYIIISLRHYPILGQIITFTLRLATVTEHWCWSILNTPLALITGLRAGYAISLAFTGWFRHHAASHFIIDIIDYH